MGLIDPSSGSLAVAEQERTVPTVAVEGDIIGGTVNTGAVFTIVTVAEALEEAPSESDAFTVHSMELDGRMPVVERSSDAELDDMLVAGNTTPEL